jgi:hypothetical protein
MQTQISEYSFQNLNGLNIHRYNHLLIQDLQTCYGYGAGVLCFPETNTNWNQEGQFSTLQGIFRGIWTASAIQTSQTPDPFLSAYKPGGTLTAVCDNWVSRIIGKGEDPFGLGRWSYVTLRGKVGCKVTIITAYNATPSPGDSTYYHQQHRVLSHLHHEKGFLSPLDPRRQFILDLQSWLEFLKCEGHQFILTMDANTVYDPDQDHVSHPLSYTASITVDSTHDGKLSTLVTTCDLCLPLATHHPTWPFPASHIRGRHQIDYMFVSKSIVPAVQRSGVLSHHSLVRGDHRPYYLDLDAAILFADPAYAIVPASFRKLRLREPRVVMQYGTNLHKLLAEHNIMS